MYIHTLYIYYIYIIVYTYMYIHMCVWAPPLPSQGVYCPAIFGFRDLVRYMGYTIHRDIAGYTVCREAPPWAYREIINTIHETVDREIRCVRCDAMCLWGIYTCEMYRDAVSLAVFHLKCHNLITSWRVGTIYIYII